MGASTQHIDTFSASRPAAFPTAVAATSAQSERLAHRLADLDPAVLVRPSGMAGWRVHEVLVHLTNSMNRLGRAVREPEARVRQVTFEEYCTATWRDAEETRRHVLEDAALVPPAQAPVCLGRAARSLVRRLESAEADKLVVMRRGTMVLSEVLTVYCLEMLTHATDVARAVGLQPLELCDPDALRFAGSLLDESDLGRTVELLQGAGDSVTSTGWLRRLCPAAA